MPYQPETGLGAKSNDPYSFVPYKTAVQASGYDGIGIGIFNGICAIDLDNCVSDSGYYTQTAAEIVALMHSYTEYSPSGNGLHILFSAKGFQYDTKRFYIMNHQAGIEVYVAGATNKYVTVTGNRCEDYEYEPAKILDLPFLFDSAEEAYEIVNGEVGEQIFAGFGDYQLVYLSEGDNGMRHISTTNKPIHTAEDVKGLKIRVPTSQLYLDVWEALGATPVALALPELALALSNGTAEAQDNATYHLVANATYDDIKYFSNINYMWMGCTMAANKATWDKLDPEVQAVLKEQAKVAAKYSFDTIASDNEAATKTLQDAGVTFDFEPDVQSFKDALGGTEYYARYANEPWFSQELLDAILAK